MFLGLPQNVWYVSFVIPIHVTTYAERLTKRSSSCWDIWSDMTIFAISSKKVQGAVVYVSSAAELAWVADNILSQCAYLQVVSHTRTNHA